MIASPVLAIWAGADQGITATVAEAFESAWTEVLAFIRAHPA